MVDTDKLTDTYHECFRLGQLTNKLVCVCFVDYDTGISGTLQPQPLWVVANGLAFSLPRLHPDSEHWIKVVDND